MTTRIEVATRVEFDDPRGSRTMTQARGFLQLPVEAVRTRTVYKLGGELSPDLVEAVRLALTDPVIEESAVGRIGLPEGCDWVISIGYRPGVTDNVGRTAGVFVADIVGAAQGAEVAPPPVFTETLYLVWGPSLQRSQLESLAGDLLANPLIERIDVASAAEYAGRPLNLELPIADVVREAVAEVVELPADDDSLLRLSRARTLALSRDEMRAIREHYLRPEVRDRRQQLGLPADPTDVELEAIAQTWSEHCKHKIFASRIKYTDESGRISEIKSLFRTYIVGTTKEVGQRVDWLVSVFDDNAGVVRIADDLNVVFKVETHNSPSALDPYGGAITGIVGVNRDPFGTGIGAALLTNTWGYCFGSPFYDGPLPQGLLHPRRIRDGVHQGVIDGGNQSGIPYSRGFEVFDDRFLGKPLVFCGTVGTMPATIAGRPSAAKEVKPGDVIVMVGGRIGKDGIHGATFSSEALHQESPAHAVQIGDPITQKMMTDMLLEARDAGLYRTLTDNGAGGLSSSVGEMARMSGGAELELDRAPLKYAGLMPWEILLSEAQERMTLAVAPEKLDELLALARRREVEATPIGRFTDDGWLRVWHAGKLVAGLALEFLHGGCPVMELEARWQTPVAAEPVEHGVDLARENIQELLVDIAGNLNYGSKSTICRQYDHEVKGLSVIKPLVGVSGDVPSDATVMRVRHGDSRGVILADAIAPQISDLDPGAMAAYVVDLAARRIIAAGGQLGRIAALDNFCWPDPVQSESTPDGQQKLAGLVRCCQALFDSCCAFDLPLISGKDSMKNDSVRGGVKISIPPTLLLSAIGWTDDVAASVDLTAGAEGQLLYMLGTTGAALGGSELYRAVARRHSLAGLVGNDIDRADSAIGRAVCEVAQQAIAAGTVSAAHAPHLGGLGLGAVTMALAAGIGLELDLRAVPTATGDVTDLALLFAETPSRLMLAIDPAHRESFEQLLSQGNVPWAVVGRFSGTGAAARLRVVGRAGTSVIDLGLAELRQHYTEALHGL